MNLKNLINYILCEEEGIAELAGQCGMNIKKLNIFLNEKTTELKNNKIKLKEFFTQYETYNKFKLRAFGMYNRALSQGYQINNSNINFEKIIEPILKNFYKNLQSL